MTSRVADDEKTIRDLLTGTTTWAVVGLSTNTFRPAYGVARFLQSVGKRIVPVHPRAETVHGEQGYRTLADVPFDVDVVARHPHVPAEDVGRHAETGDVANVARAVGVRPSDGRQDAGHDLQS